jgi:hypothetical protein
MAVIHGGGMVRLWFVLLDSAGGSRRPGGCQSAMGAPTAESIQVEGMFGWKFSARRAALSEPRRNTFNKTLETPGRGNKSGNMLPLLQHLSSDDGSTCADTIVLSCCHLSC